jgi:hypothetical protein
MPCCVLQLTFQWGCGNYSGFGDGGAWDNEGIGDNVPLEILHPCTFSPLCASGHPAVSLDCGAGSSRVVCLQVQHLASFRIVFPVQMRPTACAAVSWLPSVKEPAHRGICTCE